MKKEDGQILKEVEKVDIEKRGQAVLRGEGTGRPPEVTIETMTPWTDIGAVTMTEAGHTLVTERGPTAVTERGPTAVIETDPTTMTETGPTAVTGTDPTTVTETGPTAVTETDPTAMTETGFTIVKETGHTTMTEAGNRIKLAVTVAETGVPGQVAEVLVEDHLISVIPCTEIAAWKGYWILCHPYLE